MRFKLVLLTNLSKLLGLFSIWGKHNNLNNLLIYILASNYPCISWSASANILHQHGFSFEFSSFYYLCTILNTLKHCIPWLSSFCARIISDFDWTHNFTSCRWTLCELLMIAYIQLKSTVIPYYSFSLRNTAANQLTSYCWKDKGKKTLRLFKQNVKNIFILFQVLLYFLPMKLHRNRHFTA